MYGHHFGLIPVIKDGIKTFIKHILLFVGVGIIFFITRTLLSWVLAYGYVWLAQMLKLSAENYLVVLALNFGLSFLIIAIMTWLLLGNIKIALDAVDHKKNSIKSLFTHFSIGLVILQIVLQVVASLLLTYLGFTYGQILILVLILAGLVYFGFTFHFVSDKNMNVFSALKHSAMASKSSVLSLILLWGLVLVLSVVRNMIPAMVYPGIPLDFSGLILYPLLQPILLILTHAYRRLVPSHS